MPNSYIKKDDENIYYSAKIKSLYGDSRIKRDPEKKKEFQEIVVTRNNLEFNIRLNNYYKKFDSLNDKDKRRVLNKMSEFFVGKKIEFQGKIKDDHHYGMIMIIDELGNKTSINNEIERLTKAILRSESLSVNAKYVQSVSHESIIVNYKGQMKEIALDLLDTSVDNLNQREKNNLSMFIHSQLENEKSLNIKITGIYDDKWLVQINNLNLKISNLLDKDFNNDEPYEALVSKVVDGDTVIVYKKNKRINLRLSNIDSPEKNQDFGFEATTFLRSLMPSRAIIVEPEKQKGYYGRTIAKIKSKDSGKVKDLNKEMVLNGFAYSTGLYNEYKEEEEYADKQFKGLWINNPLKTDKPNIFRRFKKK